MTKSLICGLVMVCAAANAQSNEVAAPAGVGLKHLERIDQRVFGGSKPHSDKDFEFLQSLGVRYIVNARFLPFFSGSERSKARKYGMTLVTLEMNASLVPPSREHVDKILRTLHDGQSQPVYLHCVLGRDRTSLIGGLYRIYFLGVAKADAWRAMKQAGFPSWWGVRGLKIYFDKNADKGPA